MLNKDIKKTNNNTLTIIVTITITILIVILIILLLIYYIISQNKNEYYFEDNTQNEETIEQTANTQTQISSQTSKKGKYKTAIVTDNVYTGITINNVNEAYKLISQDSNNQKDEDYPKEIIEVENDIINKYKITAVNLKEMDVEFAKELENVIKNIYEQYPGARGYLTNLTLTNLNLSQEGVIAQFMPIFTFATSNTSTTRPWIIKTQIQLNAKYFLNPERINASIQTSSKSGHFPPNATKYSPVAHELGHYVSFIALLNHYYTQSIVMIKDNQMQNYYDIYKDFADGNFSKQILDEAYKEYITDNENIDFDQWRGQISGYALAKDNSGNYIYDETIAEAFHDVYLNNNNAKEASKYIVRVLKKYVGE